MTLPPTFSMTPPPTFSMTPPRTFSMTPPRIHYMTPFLRSILACTALLFSIGCGAQPDSADAGDVALAEGAGVAAAHPLAVEAGLDVLRAGGSALDAAVAVQAMLGLVEPQSSGLGGGAFLMHLDGTTGEITMLDGRETAPAAATPEHFLRDDGTPLPFGEAVLSGLSTGTPGVIPMLGEAHARFGRLPWDQLFDAAIATADAGFEVPPRLAQFAGGSVRQASQPDVRSLFSRDDGTPVQAGDWLTNPAYAETVRRIAQEGPRALHTGDIAEDIVARVRDEPRPGPLTAEDLAGYEPVERDALCRPYREHVVCVPPPPSSGASLLQLLALLEHTDIAERGPTDPQSWFLFAEASRLMYADRDQFIADPDFVGVPVEGLLDPAYVAGRARLIGEVAGPAPVAGSPEGAVRGADRTLEPTGTSHLVVVDEWGNVVSMTTTIESYFGSGRAVHGFLLNNELTDFSFTSMSDGEPVANAVAGGKRPRSSMVPTIVMDADGTFRAALGSPGGTAILAYNAKLLVGLLAWDLPMQEAIDLPNLLARGASFAGERAKFSPDILEELDRRGIDIQPGTGEDSGLHGVIVREGGRLEGAADPRRDGVWRTVGADGRERQP